VVITLQNYFSDVLATGLSFRILCLLKPAGLTQAELVQSLGGDLGYEHVGRALVKLERARLVTRIIIGANSQWWLCREGLLEAISQFNDCLKAMPEEQDAVLCALGGKTARMSSARQLFHSEDRVFVLQAVSARSGTISDISHRIRPSIPITRIRDCLGRFETVDLVYGKAVRLGVGHGTLNTKRYYITRLGRATLRVLADAKEFGLTF
jgi:hypothetical protein